MLEIGKRYQKSGSMVARKVAEEFILVPIRQNVGGMERIYSLKGVGARIWELLELSGTREELVSAIIGEYQVDRSQAEADLVEFLADMESIGAIIAV